MNGVGMHWLQLTALAAAIFAAGSRLAHDGDAIVLVFFVNARMHYRHGG